MVHGGVESTGSASDILGMTPEAALEMTLSQLETADQVESTQETHELTTRGKKEDKLIVSEEIALGRVGWNACMYDCSNSHVRSLI